jgi:hypothetical protein
LDRLIEGNAASEANAPRMRDALVNVGISLKADLVAGGIESRSARQLGIPDEPVDDLVRQARRSERDLPLFEFAGIEMPALERGERVLEAVAV